MFPTSAWSWPELSQNRNVFVVPGAHRAATILDSLQAADMELSEEEMDRLNRAATA